MKEPTQQQKITALENEVRELRKILMSLKSFVGQEYDEDYTPMVILKIDPKENQRFSDLLAAQELEFSKAG